MQIKFMGSKTLPGSPPHLRRNHNSLRFSLSLSACRSSWLLILHPSLSLSLFFLN
ncbi:unnamed protein product, partial [Musa acuminata var. zebrina]